MKYERSSVRDLLTAMNLGGESMTRAPLSPLAENANENESGRSAILGCLYEWNLEMLEMLLAADPELDIFEASALGRKGRVAELLAGDRRQACSWSGDGLTPLHLASFYGQQEMVAYLLEAGADPTVRARNEGRGTPLHEAVSTGQLDIVIMLLTHGAEVDATDGRGWTALHFAAAQGNREIVEALLQFGAALGKNDEGQTARDLALLNKRAEVVQLLDCLWNGYEELWPSLTPGGLPR